MKVTQDWNDKEVEAHVNDEVLKRLEKSAIIVQGEIKLVITEKGLVDTGLYRGTITYEMFPERLTARVGSPIGSLTNPRKNPPYPLYLELGTVKMQAYAPMRTGLSNSRSRLNAIWR